MLFLAFFSTVLMLGGVPVLFWLGAFLPLLFFFHWSLDAAVPKSVLSALLLGLLLGAFIPMPLGIHAISLMLGVFIVWLGKRIFGIHYPWGDITLIAGGFIAYYSFLLMASSLAGAPPHLSFLMFLSDLLAAGALLYFWFLLLQRRERDPRRETRRYAI